MGGNSPSGLSDFRLQWAELPVRCKRSSRASGLRGRNLQGGGAWDQWQPCPIDVGPCPIDLNSAP